MLKLRNLSDYFQDPFKASPAALSENDNLSFHWSDFAEACQMYKTHLKKNKNKLFDKLLDKIEGFKRTSVWLKHEHQIFHLDLYVIYDCFVQNRALPGCGLNKIDSTEVSFVGPNGPFKKINLGECLNADSYSYFVFHKLLTEQIQMRNFRLRCQGSIICYLDPQHKKAMSLDVLQLTSDGLLFACKDVEIEKKLAGFQTIRPLIDLGLFKDALNQSLDEVKNRFSNFHSDLFFTKDNRYEYIIDPKKCKFSYGYDSYAKGQCYIYCPYENIQGQNSLLIEVLKMFTNQLRDEISDVMKQAA
ncbi:MAG: hypothetical protein JNM93_09390 [Bacteriovoracaceae bacterium]|nr:hypothetical protein [Bacteriovoracaceae bacterium]